MLCLNIVLFTRIFFAGGLSKLPSRATPESGRFLPRPQLIQGQEEEVQKEDAAGVEGDAPKETAAKKEEIRMALLSCLAQKSYRKFYLCLFVLYLKNKFSFEVTTLFFVLLLVVLLVIYVRVLQFMTITTLCLTLLRSPPCWTTSPACWI